MKTCLNLNDDNNSVVFYVSLLIINNIITQKNEIGSN